MNTQVSTPAQAQDVALLEDGSPRMTISAMQRIAANQQKQDWVFHQLTRLFSLLVLAALAGIIVSLIVGAWPALREFGFTFLTTARWAPCSPASRWCRGTLSPRRPRWWRP